MDKVRLIQMRGRYPYGWFLDSGSEVSSTQVHKLLQYQSQEDYELLQHMVHFIKASAHPYLINLINISQQPQQVHLFYQYVPLKLEPWLIEVSHDLAEQLLEQLVELAEFLTRSSINFKFDPESIGLNLDMNVKYFLREFTVDLQNQEQNFANIKQSIVKYFSQLMKEQAQQSRSRTRPESISTNCSESALELQEEGQTRVPSRESEIGKGCKFVELQLKINSSKQKSMMILQRIKKLARVEFT